MDQLELQQCSVTDVKDKHLFGENCFNNPPFSPDKDEGKLEESDTAK